MRMKKDTVLAAGAGKDTRWRRIKLIEDRGWPLRESIFTVVNEGGRR